MKDYFARGKLLLSAEYLVMYGAQALALPLKAGQHMQISSPAPSPDLSWDARHANTGWFSARYRPSDMQILESSDPHKAANLAGILNACIRLKPSFRAQLAGAQVVTRLDFPPLYGWGASSTLLTLLAQWADVDPFRLHFAVSQGSAYDIACALADGPILYQLENRQPIIQAAPFCPLWKSGLWFAWQGHKQATTPHLSEIRPLLDPDAKEIDAFSRLSSSMMESPDLDEFGRLMEEHEERLSHLLGQDPLKKKYPAIPGYIKSLGAWGGDFFMIASEAGGKDLKKSLQQYGLKVVYAYEEIVHEGS